MFQAGHKVTVFERNTHIGGLLRYGIPTMKLGKDVSTAHSKFPLLTSIIEVELSDIQSEGISLD